ncbi:MAG TPA: hypothetical protein VFE23_09410 [Usitatibacter sp.]|jgi:hypothetical protein|nr:hypothetical protein [Usitatibacter sp.]
MNHQLWNRVATRVIAIMFVMAGAAACDRHRDGTTVGATSGSAPLPASADASAKTIDVPPAPPTGDPPGTTPVVPDTSNISKSAAQTGPREGDDHSYSSVAPANPQKAQNVDPQQTPDRTDLNKTEGQPK